MTAASTPRRQCACSGLRTRRLMNAATVAGSRGAENFSDCRAGTGSRSLRSLPAPSPSCSPPRLCTPLTRLRAWGSAKLLHHPGIMRPERLQQLGEPAVRPARSACCPPSPRAPAAPARPGWPPSPHPAASAERGRRPGRDRAWLRGRRRSRRSRSAGYPRLPRGCEHCSGRCSPRPCRLRRSRRRTRQGPAAAPGLCSPHSHSAQIVFGYSPGSPVCSRSATSDRPAANASASFATWSRRSTGEAEAIAMYVRRRGATSRSVSRLPASAWSNAAVGSRRAAQCPAVQPVAVAREPGSVSQHGDVLVHRRRVVKPTERTQCVGVEQPVP